jgi:hypothetical protein
MSEFKRIPLKIDAATGRQINAYGAVAREVDYFRLLFDETVILCCEFYDIDWSTGAAVLTAHPIYEDMTLAAFGDCDFNPETAFMFLTEQNIDPELNHINSAGDWIGNATANRTLGQLSLRINTNTDRFAAALTAAKSSTKYYFIVTGVPAGETEKSVLAYFRFKAENRPSSSAGAPSSADPEYLNAQQTVALLKAAPEIEFSIDGATAWHDTQDVNADHYYRERRLEGEWSDPIEIPFPPAPALEPDTFTNADLVDGVLTITHTDGDVIYPYIIIDGDGKNVTLDSTAVVFSNNQITVDLSPLCPISGTWKYLFAGMTGIQGIQGIQGPVGPASSSIMSINTQPDSYTLVIGDAGKTIRMNCETDNVLTIPANDSVALIIGAVIYVSQIGAGITSITAAAGVTINGVTAGTGTILGQYYEVKLLKIAENDWDITGSFGGAA